MLCVSLVITPLRLLNYRNWKEGHWRGTSLKEPSWCAFVELKLLVSRAKLYVQSLV